MVEIKIMCDHSDIAQLFDAIKKSGLSTKTILQIDETEMDKYRQEFLTPRKITADEERLSHILAIIKQHDELKEFTELVEKYERELKNAAKMVLNSFYGVKRGKIEQAVVHHTGAKDEQ